MRFKFKRPLKINYTDGTFTNTAELAEKIKKEGRLGTKEPISGKTGLRCAMGVVEDVFFNVDGFTSARKRVTHKSYDELFKQLGGISLIQLNDVKYGFLPSAVRAERIARDLSSIRVWSWNF